MNKKRLLEATRIFCIRFKIPEYRERAFVDKAFEFWDVLMNTTTKRSGLLHSITTIDDYETHVLTQYKIT